MWFQLSEGDIREILFSSGLEVLQLLCSTLSFVVKICLNSYLYSQSLPCCAAVVNVLFFVVPTSTK